MELINPTITAPDRVAPLRAAFGAAQPYKHLVLDNFLRPEVAEVLSASFPAYERMNKKYKGLNEFKAEGSNFEDFDPMFARLRDEIKSPAFCKWLSEVTGIEDLYSVQDALGAGLHQGGDGSFLDVHIDFNIHVEHNIHRRINLLIYLTKDWKPEYGAGGTELWNADMSACERVVDFVFNRCLIFETNEISYHGYDKVHLPPGVNRKSFYAYYYTDLRADAVKYHDTVFKARPTDARSKKLMTPVKEQIKNFVKARMKDFGIKL